MKEICKACGDPRRRYYKDGTCKTCFAMDEVRKFNEALKGGGTYEDCVILPVCPETAKKAGVDWYYTHKVCKNGPHMQTKMVGKGGDYCSRCRDPKRAIARRKGKVEYLPLHPCPDCGTRAHRDVETNICSECDKHRIKGRDTKTTRHIASFPDSVLTKEQAIAIGLKAYRTGEPCRRGHTGWRDVATGNCRDCKAEKRNGVPHADMRNSLSVEMAKNNPGMIISKKDAISAGFKIYRTGGPCRRGHTGWRYVSTGHCLDCLRNVESSGEMAEQLAERERQEWADMRAESIKAQKDAGNYTG